MDVIISPGKVDGQECQILVIGFFKDERPLKGSSGWIDWRLNGMVSHFIMEGKLIGEWKETTLIPSQGRISSPMILLLGLGKRKEFSYLRLRQLFPYMVETLRKLSSNSICFSLPYGEDIQVDCGKLAEVLIEAMVDSLECLKHSFDEEWIKKLQIYFAEGEEHFYEILSGIQTAQSLFAERLPIRILTPGEGSSARWSKV